MSQAAGWLLQERAVVCVGAAVVVGAPPAPAEAVAMTGADAALAGGATFVMPVMAASFV